MAISVNIAWKSVTFLPCLVCMVTICNYYFIIISDYRPPNFTQLMILITVYLAKDLLLP